MDAKAKIRLLEMPETEFETLLRRTSALLRKKQNVGMAAKPVVIAKKHSSAA